MESVVVADWTDTQKVFSFNFYAHWILIYVNFMLYFSSELT